ncbi:MAG: hypothetical protein J5640_05110 [Bacteroidales bacterium]|nr:hypothetical protein [Bacteroidales bacterium]
MKRIALTLTLILLPLMSFSQNKDSQGHTLVSLWKVYQKAEAADKPQDQLNALEEIRKEAVRQHLGWDFYCAEEIMVSVRSSVNWKDRSAAQQDMEKAIDEFGEPVVVFFHRRHLWEDKDAQAFIEKHKDALLATHNPEFYKRDGRITGQLFSKAVLPLLSNDYEYAVWNLAMSTNLSGPAKSCFKDRYPLPELIEFYAIERKSSPLAYPEYGEFAEKYKGKGVALLARQRRLSYEFSQLNREKTTTSDDFKALRAKCAAFEKERGAFAGVDASLARCCTAVADLIETLDAKSIDISVSNDEASITLRNVSEFKLSIVDENGKTVYSVPVTNKTDSYYRKDLITYKFPDIDDGSYTVYCKSGTCEEKVRFEKYTLSVAVRADHEGYGAYVADYWTGEPLKKCNFLLFDADSKLITRASDVALDGFTPLPASFRQYSNAKDYRSYKLRASYTEGGRLRLSQMINISSPNPGEVREYKDYSTARVVLLTDRTAFNPGETVHFKAISYTGTYSYQLAPEGTELTVKLYDSKDQELEKKVLKTNDLGSVSGAFELVGGDRGGYYSIKVFCGDSSYHQAARRLRVDEFVLPTFEVTFDPDNTLYLTGDKIRVSGKVKAYSGHSLSSARAYYTVEGIPMIKGSDELKIGSDGSFAFEFLSSTEYRNYFPITVKIVDATGETLSFQTSRFAYDSLPIGLSLENSVPGNYTLIPGKVTNGSYSNWIVRDDFARITFRTGGCKRKGLEIRYSVKYGDNEITSGKADSQQTLDIDLKGKPSGLYLVEAVVTANDASGKQRIARTTHTFVKATDTDTALDMPVYCFFKELGGEDIAIQVGATDGPVWAVVELAGSGNVILEKQIIHLEGVQGKKGSLMTVGYARKPEYSENLTLTVLFFRNANVYTYSRTIRLPVVRKELPLSYERFIDLATPGQECKFLIRSLPGVECAATVFDKATETIEPNVWSEVYPSRRPEASISYRNQCGVNGSSYYFDELYETRALGSAKGVRYKAAGRGAEVVYESAMNIADAVAISEDGAAPEPEAQQEVHVRDNFSATMAWEPCLRSDKDGLIEFNCKGADRLSTFYVQLFAHGEGMLNAVLRKEMKVSIPVKVAIVEPQFLYAGDTYTAKATLSNNLEKPVSGRVAIRFYDGADYKTAHVLATRTERVTLQAGGSRPFDVPLDVPSGFDAIGVLVNFIADEAEYGSDAMFVAIPVKTPLQTLTEAHSALLKAGADREELLAYLRGLFVNVDAAEIEPVERSIIDMIKDAIPDKIEPKSSNVLDLTEAYYSNVLARRLGAPGLSDSELKDILDKIAACQNRSGGISWFEGMESSPVITAAVLQRIAAMPEQDLSAIDTEAAVKYLDDIYFDRSDMPYWWGGISLGLYLQTRALYPQVPFKVPSGKALREFKKDAKDYLVPKKKRGLNAQILAKARRLRTLQSLVQLPGGKDLAKSWGISIKKCLVRSLDADVESLLQYAVEHRSGGYYYPNAVMPWRGLLESELYAHSLLCDLLTNAAAAQPSPKYAEQASSIAEGIRLWIMVQKETQQWEKDAAYIEAISSVLRGTPETLATKVILLSKSFTKPFAEVKAAGNGFKISRQFIVDGRQISDGDTLKVGDKVLAQYSIWNEENRSFVRVTVPRPASFRPVRQLSGHYGWWLTPYSYGGWSFSPQGYRNVLSDKTEYWFDSYPEEHTTITEEFYVTQEGAFQTPAVEIESLYAPHYRANDDGRGPVLSK